MREHRQALKLTGVLVWVRLAGELLKVLPNEPIDTRSKSLGAAAGAEKHFVVDG